MYNTLYVRYSRIIPQDSLQGQLKSARKNGCLDSNNIVQRSSAPQTKRFLSMQEEIPRKCVTLHKQFDSSAPKTLEYI